jgi:hypothetical protein
MALSPPSVSQSSVVVAEALGFAVQNSWKKYKHFRNMVCEIYENNLKSNINYTLWWTRAGTA